MEGVETESSAWRPLRHPVFRALWLATVASNIGTSMHEVGAAWLMASLAPTPLMVSLVQTTMCVPLFLLAVPAGALADIIDRRRLLLITQTWMLLAAAGLAAVTASGTISPGILLLFTFVLGVGAAANTPAWRAITPELVPRAELPTAITLNGMANNVSRAIGPALGGLIVAAGGPQAVFGLNAVSFLSVLAVLARWKREHRVSTLPTERFFDATRAGIRYALHARGFGVVLARVLLFIFPASALWALLPLLARQKAELTAAGYGLLLGVFGAGAVAAATVLPRLRARRTIDALFPGATALLATSMIGIASFTNPVLLGLFMFPAGAAWLTMLSSLNNSAQSVSADWVKARALSVYVLVFFGGMAFGSLLWGALANLVGIDTAMIVAALILAASIGSFRSLPLTELDVLDLVPSIHWPVPAGTDQQPYDRGPVLVTVGYVVPAQNLDEFLSVMRELKKSRLRDGAYRWRLYEDTAAPGHYLECFVVESWLEHLRQHERVTEEERRLQDQIQQFNQGTPIVSHYVATNVDGP